jgi:hypothetical protein
MAMFRFDQGSESIDLLRRVRSYVVQLDCMGMFEYVETRIEYKRDDLKARHDSYIFTSKTHSIMPDILLLSSMQSNSLYTYGPFSLLCLVYITTFGL